MDVSGYTTDDLILFRRVLDRAIAEADSDMPVELMARSYLWPPVAASVIPTNSSRQFLDGATSPSSW